MAEQKNKPKPRPRRGKGGRWLYCPRYLKCLDRAVKKKWQTFTCEYCLLWPARPPARRTRKPCPAVCAKCGAPEKAVYAKGLCRPCYDRAWWLKRKDKPGVCVKCGGLKVIYAKGLCRPCYQRAGYLKSKAAGEKGKANGLDL